MIFQRSLEIFKFLVIQTQFNAYEYLRNELNLKRVY